jgi:hypothetical protein
VPAFADRALAAGEQAFFQFVEAGQHLEVDRQHLAVDAPCSCRQAVP